LKGGFWTDSYTFSKEKEKVNFEKGGCMEEKSKKSKSKVIKPRISNWGSSVWDDIVDEEFKAEEKTEEYVRKLTPEEEDIVAKAFSYPRMRASDEKGHSEIIRLKVEPWIARRVAEIFDNKLIPVANTVGDVWRILINLGLSVVDAARLIRTFPGSKDALEIKVRLIGEYVAGLTEWKERYYDNILYPCVKALSSREFHNQKGIKDLIEQTVDELPDEEVAQLILRLDDYAVLGFIPKKGGTSRRAVLKIKEIIMERLRETGRKVQVEEE
jgi:hypothetical protein